MWPVNSTLKPCFPRTCPSPLNKSWRSFCTAGRWNRLFATGVNTWASQRQWSDQALARSTPVRLGLFALLTLLAHELLTRHDLPLRTAAWYPKPLPTFSDALALVRHSLGAYLTFQISPDEPDMIKLPRVLLDRFHDLLCFTT